MDTPTNRYLVHKRMSDRFRDKLDRMRSVYASMMPRHAADAAASAGVFSSPPPSALSPPLRPDPCLSLFPALRKHLNAKRALMTDLAGALGASLWTRLMVLRKIIKAFPFPTDTTLSLIPSVFWGPLAPPDVICAMPVPFRCASCHLFDA